MNGWIESGRTDSMCLHEVEIRFLFDVDSLTVYRMSKGQFGRMQVETVSLVSVEFIAYDGTIQPLRMCGVYP